MARRSSFSPSGLGGLPRFLDFSMRRILVTQKTLDKPYFLWQHNYTRTRGTDMVSVIESIKAAAKARIERPTGVVVMYQAEVSGWMDRLRDPQHWMPGCVAVLADGSAFVARGGNDYDGAQEWVPANA